MNNKQNYVPIYRGVFVNNKQVLWKTDHDSNELEFSVQLIRLTKQSRTT